MARIRWFRANWPISLRALVAKMKTTEFNAESQDGFILERARDSLIEGQYIEKRLLEDVAVDPFGNEQRTESVDYRRVRFRIVREFPQIQVWNTSRSLHGFVSRLAEMNNFALAIEPVIVNVEKWCEILSLSDQWEAQFAAIQIGEIAFQDGVVGKMFLRGENAREVMKQLVKSLKHSVERVIVRVTVGGKAKSVQLFKDGAASFGTSAPEQLIECVRECLRMAVET